MSTTNESECLDKTREERFELLLDALNEGLYERQNIVNKTFLTSMSGESIFLLGPPGVAKSLIARRLKQAFHGATSFEYLMNRFSTPEEIFGPISITKLRDEDKLERRIDNYLPAADIAFLDEIWKAGPSIQNTLLTIINEKIYRNGTEMIDVPLLGLITASNELPDLDSGLGALWDRFIIRLPVDNIESTQAFKHMITDTSELTDVSLPSGIRITKAEHKSFQTCIRQVEVGEICLSFLSTLREVIEEINTTSDQPELLYVSDRRWKKIVKVLRTSAFINNRNRVDLSDCLLVSDMIWNHPDQLPLIHDCIVQALQQLFDHPRQRLVQIDQRLKKFREEVTHKLRSHQVGPINRLKRVVREGDHFLLIRTVKNSPLTSEWKYMSSTARKKDPNWIPAIGEEVILHSRDHRSSQQTHIQYVQRKENRIVLNCVGMDTQFSIQMDTSESGPDQQPSKLLQIKWDYRCSTLVEELAEIEIQLEQTLGEETDSNLFVSTQNYIPLKQIEQGLQEDLSRLRLQVEEIRSYYHQKESATMELSMPSKDV